MLAIPFVRVPQMKKLCLGRCFFGTHLIRQGLNVLHVVEVVCG